MVICIKNYFSRVFDDNYMRKDKIQYVTFNNNGAYNPGISGNYKMARRKRGFHLLAGILLGIVLAHVLRIYLRNIPADSRSLGELIKCSRGSRKMETKTSEPAVLDPFKIIGNIDDKQTIHNSKRSLLFVGVMTADKYLKNRASAVYRTWGRELPGSLAFFSSSQSRSNVLPLVSLKGVDDSYPPQKKSFMMLLYMHDNFIDKFEWFLRADDDVFIKADKLETLLRSVDSRRAQFIGQAGRGNSEEFGSLSLEYDENFCMGGPGVIMSRETLKRIAPHIKECLKNLYTTHEDVELGRCVQKFAGVPCTWSYEMQSILYHNSSGSLAFTGNLKKREVHLAITMHPVKDHHHMYRIHSYLKNLKIQELKETIISLHRDVLIAANELKMEPYELATFNVAKDVPLFPNMQGHSGYLGDTNILGVAPNLNRYHPNKLKSVLSWDFISKAVFSPDNSNPKRRMEFSMKEGLDDIIRELMENINAFSKQRGRVIEFREILYGYQRLDPIHGADYILDILLVYKKYRGRKMTVPVRRHAYLQQSFTGLEIHEVTFGDNQSSKKAVKYENSEQIDYDTDNIYPGGESGASTPSSPFINFKKLNVPIREVFETGMLKISEKLPYVFRSQPIKDYQDSSVQIINFILPLSGRFDIFVRFMKNYEEICLKGDKRTSLIITLYNDKNNPSDFNRTIDLINSFSKKYQYAKITPIKITDSQFSRALALEKGVEVCNQEDLLFLIDVDILFNAESLQRVRLNTVRSHQAYFPIVFSEYDPGVVNGEEYNVIKINKMFTSKELSDSGNVVGDHVYMKAQSDSGNKYYTKPEMLSDDRGYFRQFGFGIASVYKSDFVVVGGFNTDIKGWGLEDVHLYDKFVQSNVSIFRSVDAGLVHVFHPVDCDKNLELAQYNMCIGTRANTFGSIKHMILYLFNHPKIVNVIQPVNTDDKPRTVP